MRVGSVGYVRRVMTRMIMMKMDIGLVVFVIHVCYEISPLDIEIPNLISSPSLRKSQPIAHQAEFSCDRVAYICSPTVMQSGKRTNAFLAAFVV